MTDKSHQCVIIGIAGASASGKSLIASTLYRELRDQVGDEHIGVIPGLKEYVEFFGSDDMAGPDGPLAAYGLVSDPELAATQAAVAAEEVMARIAAKETAPIARGKFFITLPFQKLQGRKNQTKRFLRLFSQSTAPL